MSYDKNYYSPPKSDPYDSYRRGGRGKSSSEFNVIGLISFICGCLTVALIVCFFAYIIYMIRTQSEEITEESTVALVIGFGALSAAVIGLGGTILGIIGLLQEGKGKVLAALGTTSCSLSTLIIVGMLIGGLMME